MIVVTLVGMRGSALIVGGGIAGLASARALISNGWTVEIRERSPGLPATGTALGMWPPAMAALRRIGLADEVRRRAIEQRGAAFLRPDGRVIADVGDKQVAHLIARGDLLATLEQGVPHSVITYGSDVEVPNTDDYDVVVGADGIGSVVRAGAFGPDAAPRPLGTVAYRGTVPGQVDGATETWGPGRLFGVTPQRHGRINWFACLRADLVAQAELPGPVALLEAMYGDWHPIVAKVIAALDDKQIDQRTLYEAPHLSSYGRRRSVLIGDAAHAMAPNLGRGACEALIDAVALADALDQSATVYEGLRAYDNRRRRPSQRIMRASRLMNRMCTTPRFGSIRNAGVAVLARAA